MKRTHQGFFMGLPLPERVEEARAFVETQLQMKQETSGRYTQETLQAMLGLMGQTPDPCMIRGEEFDETVFLPKFVEGSEAFGVCNHYVTKIFLAFLFDQPEDAPALAEALEPWAPSMVSLVHVPVFHLYHSLCLLQLLRETPEHEAREAMLAFVEDSVGRLERYSVHGAANFAHRHALLIGERAAVLGDPQAARAAFKQAVILARENDYLHEEAIANERLARVWKREGEADVGELFMARARHGYALWGATAKVERLDEEFGGRLEVSPGPKGLGPASITQTGRVGLQLDVDTVLKACQAISSEVRLATLSSALMDIVIENAGAQSAVLLLDADGELEVSLARGAEAPDPVARSVVQYVARTQRALVLDDASASDRFATDPWIAETKPRSVLCEPIRHAGRVTGVLYLENNLATGAFTEDRVAVLEALSRQVAVSIENAKLFEEQQRLTESFARFVPTQYLTLLGHQSVLDLKLGDTVARDMAVMFADIRRFTTLSEGMSPGESFAFVNAFLALMGPLIRENEGFIDGYTGDGFLALFPEGASTAMQAACAMQARLDEHNAARAGGGQAPIDVGFGVHYGPLIAGVLGEPERLKGSVVGDTVNTASRLEGLTKFFACSVVVSGPARAEAPELAYRRLGRTLVAGRQGAVETYQLLSVLPESIQARRVSTRPDFEAGVELLEAGRGPDAVARFEAVLEADAEDAAAAAHLARARAGGGPLKASK